MNKQEEILEGNKLIADFMGLKVTHSYTETAFNNNLWCVYELKYHTSWDWLMPVVEKICEIHNQADVELYRAIEKADLQIIYNTSILCHKRDVYIRVIEFIKWCNNQYIAK